MTLPLTLPAQPLEHPAMDYAFLRREGIRILERLGGQLWTDFNAHDPGITILEQLCYAITDLAYRINYDIKDILTHKGEDADCSLHSPAQVLTTRPVTLTDLRKLAIDVPGVKNAWFEPEESVKPGLLYDPSEETLYLETTSAQPSRYERIPVWGVYRVLLETDNELAQDAAGILSEVNRRLQAGRALCQDFLYPTILPGQGIIVRAEIEVGAVDDPEGLLAEIYYTLARFISPSVHFYTLPEMLAQGKSIDQIMNGPALQHGFIDDAELEQLERKAGLRTSDLIQEILNVEGTVAVSTIKMSESDRPDVVQAWYLKLDPERAPFLNMDKSLSGSDAPAIRLMREGIQVQADPGRVLKIVRRLQQAARQEPLPESQRDILLPPGRDRRIGRYHSIQHQFPAAYGIGSTGLADSASALRKAQAKQFKAYLLFFDQLLANYFAQLASVRKLFSFHTPQSRTYFSQIVDDANLGLDQIRKTGPLEHAATVKRLTDESGLQAETVDAHDPAAAGRKNRFLNHLLARFAEQFTDYSLLLYASQEEGLIEDKSAFLRDYKEIGAGRGCGFDYTQKPSSDGIVSGLEKRIGLKLGMVPHHKRDLASMPAGDREGGFYLLEHLLLRPSLADEEQWVQAAAGTGWQASALIKEPSSNDPYSGQVSYVFPKWIQRFSQEGFRELIEKTVREETPAHIRVYLHWLDRDQMLAFESAYHDWLENMFAAPWWDLHAAKPGDKDRHMIHIRLRDARDRIIRILGIGAPYPLRDLILVYPTMVAHNRTADIQIMGGQAGVSYRLCDEDGNQIPENGEPFELYVEPGMPQEKMLLPTPVILRDITFTVLAFREDKQEELSLETYLNEQVEIKAGINTGLSVEFVPSANQAASGNQLIVNYRDQIAVRVDGTQDGISYKLVRGRQDAPVTISSPVKGNLGTITLKSTLAFEEDTQVRVLAYRTSNYRISALLDTVLDVLVRPKPAVTVRVETPIVDYGRTHVVQLIDAQKSVEYQLYQRELVPGDYLPDQTEGSLIVKTDEGRSISIAVPEKVTDWDASLGFVLVDTFERTDDLTARTGTLFEDTLFIIRAIKIENREELQLDQAAAVLVRPNRAPIVDAKKTEVERGKTGMVTVEGTQKGVAYQLRFDKNNEHVNLPGYHFEDRGLERVRVQVDLVVGEQGKPILLLPTGPITRATAFNVLASKILTGVSAQLKGTVTIRPPALLRR